MTNKKTSDQIIPAGKEYEPPSTLAAAQRDARHFHAASLIHLGTIEVMQRQIDELQRQRRPDPDVRRLLLEVVRLRDENARLRETARIASAAWLGYARKYQGAPALVH